MLIISVAPGDREHIPQSDQVIFEVLSEHLARLRQNTPVSIARNEVMNVHF